MRKIKAHPYKNNPHGLDVQKKKSKIVAKEE